MTCLNIHKSIPNTHRQEMNGIFSGGENRVISVEAGQKRGWGEGEKDIGSAADKRPNLAPKSAQSPSPEQHPPRAHIKQVRISINKLCLAKFVSKWLKCLKQMNCWFLLWLVFC